MKPTPGLVYAAIFSVCIAGAALAQEDTLTPATEAPAFRPQFEPRPSARARRYMPTIALEHQIAGAVILCCTPREDRSLSCTVGFETPRSIGFGNAARSLMDSLQLTEASYADYLSTMPGAPFQRVTQFRLESQPAPALPPASERASLCQLQSN